MINKTKKGQVITGVLLWFFLTFFYFVIGYPIFRGIMDSIISNGDYTGIALFFANISPFIPVIGLVWWGYKIINPPGDIQE